MATVFTSNLRLALPTNGTEAGTWGDTVNNGITTLVDTSVSGTASITMTTADYTLTTANGSTDEARAMFITIGGAPGAARNVICPAVSKLYFVYNNTTGGFAQTFKTSAGTGISVPNGKMMVLRCDGTNVVSAISYFDALALNSPTLTTPALGTPASGNFSTGTFTWPTFNQDTTGYASALKSASTTVNVSSATAPSNGQVLTATSSTAATWQTPTPGVTTGKSIAMAMIFGF